MKRIRPGRKSIRTARLSKQAVFAAALASAMASVPAKARFAAAENSPATRTSAGTATWSDVGVAWTLAILGGNPVKSGAVACSLGSGRS